MLSETEPEKPKTTLLSQTGATISRLVPLDALRGMIIIVMALDHANYFVAREHPPSEFFGRSMPRYDDALDFFTRYVTHLAAPGFFALLGAGVWLYTASAKKAGDPAWLISGRLALRGAILIALQFLVENRAWPLIYGGGGGSPYFGVLYGLGMAMLACAVLVHLPSWALGIIGLLCLFSFEIWQFTGGTGAGRFETWQRALLVPGNSADASVLYPALPWLGVAIGGVLFGRYVGTYPVGAYRAALWGGLFSIGLFIALRLTGGFGNLRPATSGGDFLNFLYVVKYPPSLAFLSITLGVNLLMLWLFSLLGNNRIFGHGLNPLLVFGRSALFFYIAHLYLYAWLGMQFAPRGSGIPAMYPWWLVGLALLYPLCWAWGKFKHSRARNSLWRLF